MITASAINLIASCYNISTTTTHWSKKELVLVVASELKCSSLLHMIPAIWKFIRIIKHTTTLFALSDHYILSREWRAIVDQVQTNYHGRSIGTIISQMWPSCWLWGVVLMVECVLSQLKPSKLYILSCGKCLDLRPRHFPQLRISSCVKSIKH